MTIWLASKERTQASRTSKASPLTKAPLAPCLATVTPRAGSAAGDRSRRPRVPPYLGPTASTGSCSATAGSRSSAGATPRPPRERVGGAAVRPAQSPGTRGHHQGKANQGRPLRSGRLRSPTCARAGAPPPPPPRSARRNSGPEARGASVGARRRGASTKAPLHTSLRRQPPRAQRSTLWRESRVRGQPGPHRELPLLKLKNKNKKTHPTSTVYPETC